AFRTPAASVPLPPQFSPAANTVPDQYHLPDQFISSPEVEQYFPTPRGVKHPVDHRPTPDSRSSNDGTDDRDSPCLNLFLPRAAWIHDLHYRRGNFQETLPVGLLLQYQRFQRSENRYLKKRLRDDYNLGHLVQGIFERTVKPTQEDYEDANKRLEQVQTPGSYLPRQLPSEAGLGYFKLLSLLTTAHRRSGDHLAAYLRRTRSLLTQLVLEYPPEYTPSPAGTPDLDRQLQLIGPVHDSDQSSEGEEEVSEEVLVLSPASQAVVNSEAITAFLSTVTDETQRFIRWIPSQVFGPTPTLYVRHQLRSDASLTLECDYTPAPAFNNLEEFLGQQFSTPVQPAPRARVPVRCTPYPAGPPTLPTTANTADTEQSQDY
ncbi:hypothetical protein B484DRAFT_425982, partial [Ochromonadaceae sp. CCMP2298]